MKYNIIENFRNVDGDHEKPWCTCDYCGKISEIYVEICILNFTPVKVCKGCLTRMIEKMDDTMIAKILSNEYCYQKDDSYRD